MNRSNEMSLGDAIEAVFKQYHLQDKIDGIRIINAWPKVAGKMIENHTTDLFVKNNVLFVYIDSDVIRNELSYSRELLIKNLNKETGKDFLKDIVFK